MAGHSIKKIDDMEAIYGGGFKRARAELGVSAFGFQIIDMPPNADQYPEHDHSEDGMEEVYVVLRGSGEIEIDGERNSIDPETFVAVRSGTKRKIYAGDEGIRVLAIGGKPGEAYEPPDITKLGEPDPMSA